MKKITTALVFLFLLYSTPSSVIALTKTFTPTSDASISSLLPTLNTGNSPLMNVSYYQTPPSESWLFLKFNIDDLPPSINIDSASLWLYLDESNSGTDIHVNVYPIKSNWSENGVNWGNKPDTFSTSIFEYVHHLQYQTYYQYNLTQAIKNWHANNTNYQYGFAIKILPRQGFASLNYKTKEASSLIPKLIVSYSILPNPTPTPTNTPSPTPTPTPQEKKLSPLSFIFPHKYRQTTTPKCYI